MKVFALVMFFAIGLAHAAYAKNLSCKSQKIAINQSHLLLLSKQFEAEAEMCQHTSDTFEKVLKQTVEDDLPVGSDSLPEDQKKDYIEKVMPRLIKAINVSCLSELQAFSDEISKIEEKENLNNTNFTHHFDVLIPKFSQAAQNINRTITDNIKDIENEKMKALLKTSLEALAKGLENAKENIEKQKQNYESQIKENKKCKDITPGSTEA